jgi:peptide/nickel transport system substrate-binding protein
MARRAYTPQNHRSPVGAASIELIENGEGIQGGKPVSDIDNYWKRKISQQGMSRRRVLGGAATAGLGIGALGLVGCGDDDDEGGDPTTAPGGSGTAAASPSAVQKTTGGVLRAQIPNVFDSTDVHRAFGDPTSWLSNYVLNKIVRYKNPDTGEIEGDLAESYENPDASTLTFKVRKGVKWQNTPVTNGREFTAADIKWHIERQANNVLKDGSPGGMRQNSTYKGVTVATPDDYTVQLKLPSPNAVFIHRLAGYFSTVPNREASEKFEVDHRTLTEEAMPATGPFQLKQWRANKEILFVKNPTHFRQGEPLLDGWIAPLLFEDPNAYRLAFEQKQIEAWSAPDASLTKSVLDANKDKMTESLTGVGNTVFMSLNTNQAPFNGDPRLVKAMYLAFNRRLAISTFHQGLGQVSGPVPWLQEAFAMKPDELVKQPGYRSDYALDAKDAKALWDAAGGPALGEIDIKVPDTWLASWPDTPQFLIQMFNSAFGTSQFKSTKTNYNEEIIPNLFKGTYPNWFGWTSQVNSPDPRSDFFSTFHSTGGTNFNKVNNPALDAPIASALKELDTQKSVGSILEAQKILLENGAYGQAVLYNYISRTALWNYYKSNSKVPASPGKAAQGYNIFAGHLFGSNVWLDKNDPTYQGRPAASI